MRNVSDHITRTFVRSAAADGATCNTYAVTIGRVITGPCYLVGLVHGAATDAGYHAGACATLDFDGFDPYGFEFLRARTNTVDGRLNTARGRRRSSATNYNGSDARTFVRTINVRRSGSRVVY